GYVGYGGSSGTGERHHVLVVRHGFALWSLGLCLRLPQVWSLRMDVTSTRCLGDFAGLRHLPETLLGGVDGPFASVGGVLRKHRLGRREQHVEDALAGV